MLHHHFHHHLHHLASPTFQHVLGVLGIIGWLVLVAAVVALAASYLVRTRRYAHAVAVPAAVDPVAAAELRYAKGEITKDQLTELKKDLE